MPHDPAAGLHQPRSVADDQMLGSSGTADDCCWLRTSGGVRFMPFSGGRCRTAILTFRRRTECLTSPAKIIDGDTIAVTRSSSSCTASTPRTEPNVLVPDPCAARCLSPPSRHSFRGPVLAARWSSGTGTVPRVYSPKGRHGPQARVDGLRPGVPAILDGSHRRRGTEGQGRDMAGHLRQALGVALIVTPEVHPLGSGWDATAAGRIVIVQTFAQRVGGGTSGLRYRPANGEDNIQARLNERVPGPFRKGRSG
jgi:hypothetical protein